MVTPYSLEPGQQRTSLVQYSTGDSDIHTPPSRTSSTGNADSPLIPDVSTLPQRSQTINPSLPSPLNSNLPAHPSVPPSLFSGPRTQSRQSMIFNRVPSEESKALAFNPSNPTPNRSSMLLYRLADDNEQSIPTPPNPIRQSLVSNPDSVFTVSYDSKYPSGAHTPHKFVPYPFDPSLHIDTPEDDDALHDPSDDTPLYISSRIALRGYVNVGVLILVILALLLLFIFYPIWHYIIQGH